MPDGYSLTPEDQEEIADLLAANDTDYRRAVADYLTADPGPGDHAIFRDDRLIQRTLAAVESLLAQSRSLLETPPPGHDKARRAATARFAATMKAQREILRPMVGLARQRAQVKSPDTARSRAYRRLAAEHPEEFSRILREEKNRTPGT